MGRPKKPSRLKQLAQLYKERCAREKKSSEANKTNKKAKEPEGELPDDGFVTESDNE